MSSRRQAVAQAGEDISISRRGRVVAAMTSPAKAACCQARRLGLGKAQFAVPEDVAEPLAPALREVMDRS
ncbi:MAG: hypothetical protein IK061_04010, partial [Desulfovibrio sp.]|nr:hypothetical protein [Desulfovibrio sp.]